mmetsp:Transcript_22346/g.53162  ORF Transcript_22346/g.53162 Transcript_22346/m.53162 type:complete len:462 (-) Transcript_22346:1918-3303(-)
MIAEAFIVHNSLLISMSRKRKIQQLLQISLSSDGAATDHVCMKDSGDENKSSSINKNESNRTHSRSCIAKQQFYSAKRDCEKFQSTGSFKTSLKFLLIIMMLEIGSFQVRGFSFFAIGSESTRIRRKKIQDLSARELCCQYTQQFVGSPNNGNFGSALFSTSPIAEQETLISLEWMEYFSPETRGNSTSKRNQQHTPVLFLHGLLGSKRNFATCANMLAVQLDKKRRIIGVDLRNHGDTQPWADEMSYPRMAEDVVSFLLSQNIEKVILVGHSMGGKVAQALALLYPEYVEGLVVLDIAPVTYTSEDDPHWRAVEDILRAIHEAIEETKANGTETTKRDFDVLLRKSIPDPALRAFVLTNFDSMTNQWKIPIATIVQELKQIAGFDLTTTSSPDFNSSLTYDGDVFIINGGQSRFVRHAYMDQIASYFPNHMLTTIRGSGHWVHAEAPDDLVALLKRYLDR